MGRLDSGLLQVIREDAERDRKNCENWWRDTEGEQLPVTRETDIGMRKPEKEDEHHDDDDDDDGKVPWKLGES